MSDFRPRLKGSKKDMYENFTKDEKRILVIGDIHEPFCLDSYLQHCKDAYNKFNCNQVIFIGDIIDNHYSSYHETDPNGLSGGDELDFAISKLHSWHEAFPKATVIIGNHDRLIMRKAQTSAIPKKWIKSYKEVLNVPSWEFTTRIVIDSVQYIHGEGGTARTKCRSDMMSTVQGHLHTQMYCEWYVGQKGRIFGMQVGCGIDRESYAMAYAKAGKLPAIGCGIVIGGHTAFNVPM